MEGVCNGWIHSPSLIQVLGLHCRMLPFSCSNDNRYNAMCILKSGVAPWAGIGWYIE